MSEIDNIESEISRLLVDLKTLRKSIDDLKVKPLESSFEYQSITPLMQLYKQYLNRAKLIFKSNDIFGELLDIPEKVDTKHLQRLALNVQKLIDFLEQNDLYKKYRKLLSNYNKLKIENNKLKEQLKSFGKIQ